MLCYAKNPDGCNFAQCKIHQSRRFGGKTLVLDEIIFLCRGYDGPHENYKTQPCAVVVCHDQILKWSIICSVANANKA